MIDDATIDVGLWNTGPLGKQVATAIAAIAVHHHFKLTVWKEGRAVGHADDAHLLSFGLRHVHLVVDAGGRVEVKRIVTESHALLVALRLVVEQQQVVVRTCMVFTQRA